MASELLKYLPALLTAMVTLLTPLIVMFTSIQNEKRQVKKLSFFSERLEVYDLLVSATGDKQIKSSIKLSKEQEITKFIKHLEQTSPYGDMISSTKTTPPAISGQPLAQVFLSSVLVMLIVNTLGLFDFPVPLMTIALGLATAAGIFVSYRFDAPRNIKIIVLLLATAAIFLMAVGLNQLGQLWSISSLSNSVS